jgi:hypothetical protein
MVSITRPGDGSLRSGEKGTSAVRPECFDNACLTSPVLAVSLLFYFSPTKPPRPDISFNVHTSNMLSSLLLAALAGSTVCESERWASLELTSHRVDFVRFSSCKQGLAISPGSLAFLVRQSPPISISLLARNLADRATSSTTAPRALSMSASQTRRHLSRPSTLRLRLCGSPLPGAAALGFAAARSDGYFCPSFSSASSLFS